MSKYEDNLKKSLEGIQGDLDKDNKAKKADKEQSREKRAFEKLPEYTKIEFWCENCNADFVAPAYKMWSKEYEVGSWHSFCPVCEKLVYRHITSKTLDPYYNQSQKIKEIRGKSSVDMLQPEQYGFTSQYGDPFEHYYKKHQEKHEQLYNKYAEMGLLGKTLAQKDEENDIMKELKVEH